MEQIQNIRSVNANAIVMPNEVGKGDQIGMAPYEGGKQSGHEGGIKSDRDHDRRVSPNGQEKDRAGPVR